MALWWCIGFFLVFIWHQHKAFVFVLNDLGLNMFMPEFMLLLFWWVMIPKHMLSSESYVCDVIITNICACIKWSWVESVKQWTHAWIFVFTLLLGYESATYVIVWFSSLQCLLIISPLSLVFNIFMSSVFFFHRNLSIYENRVPVYGHSELCILVLFYCISLFSALKPLHAITAATFPTRSWL